MELNISDSARQSANNWSWSGHTGDAINVEASKTVDSGWIIYRLEKII